MFKASDSVVRLLLVGTNIHSVLPETHKTTWNLILVSDPCVFLGNIPFCFGSVQEQLCRYNGNTVMPFPGEFLSALLYKAFA